MIVILLLKMMTEELHIPYSIRRCGLLSAYRDLAIEYRGAKEELEKLLAHFEFLSEYPLRVIEDTRIDSLYKKNRVTFRDLMGDHPLTPLKQTVIEDLSIEKGSLYICDTQESFFLMRPFLIRYECPKCHMKSSFFLEKFNAKEQIADLKSLEHGHVSKSAEFVDLFRKVGLLI